MRIDFRKIAGLYMMLAIFFGANHYAIEQLSSWCCHHSESSPVENESNSCETVCKDLTAITNDSGYELTKLSNPDLPLILSGYLVEQSFDLQLQNQFLTKKHLHFGIDSFNKIILSSHILVLSPNAPPVA